MSMSVRRMLALGVVLAFRAATPGLAQPSRAAAGDDAKAGATALRVAVTSDAMFRVTASQLAAGFGLDEASVRGRLEGGGIAVRSPIRA